MHIEVLQNPLCFSFQSPYAQLLAATTLTKLVSRINITLPLEQRIDIRKYRIICCSGHQYQAAICLEQEIFMPPDRYDQGI